MVGGGGLKRTVSRGNLWDPSSNISSLGAKDPSPVSDANGEIKRAAPSEAPTLSMGSHESKSPTKNIPYDAASTSQRPGIKRSHSFGAMDRRDNYGQESVENISGKVVLPGKALDRHPPQAREVISSGNTANFGSKDAPRGQCEPALDDDEYDSTPESSDIPQLITSSPGSQLTDDLELKPEAREHVDYFSHDWREGDIADSWRYIISRKRREEIANAARLENASWRMWAKAKYNLKTVSPAVVNWLKDYDVTWLYGPLFHSPTISASNSPACSPAPSTDRKESEPPLKLHPSQPKLKPILKRKSMAQLMLEESAPPEANYMRHYNYRDKGSVTGRKHAADILNRQYNTNDDSESLETPTSEHRHVHFNDRVEQCVALEPQEAVDISNDIDDEAVDSDDDEDEDDAYESDDSNNGGLFLGVRRPSSIDTVAGAHIIQTLPATTLKYDDDEELKKQRETPLIHGSRRPGFNANYNYHAVYEPNQDTSYKIVDPSIKPVELQAGPSGKIEGPKRRVRPTASFG